MATLREKQIGEKGMSLTLNPSSLLPLHLTEEDDDDVDEMRASPEKLFPGPSSALSLPSSTPVPSHFTSLHQGTPPKCKLLEELTEGPSDIPFKQPRTEDISGSSESGEDKNHDQQMSEQEYTNLSNSQPAITFANTATNNGLVYLLQPPPTTVVQKQQAVQVSQNGGTIDVPALKDMRGNYDFNVTVKEEWTTKSLMWLMSKITNKLYTSINKTVPFEVRLNNLVPRNRQLIIRAVAVFSSAQFLRNIVTRCPTHASLVDPTNHDFPYPDHVLRADHPGAQYECSPNGRLSVVVPLETLQDGSSFMPILLRFMCLGSCVGGMNRRPIAIILTLEDREGLILGRKVFDVRVCFSLTRDIEIDEAALTNKGPKRKSSVLGSQDKVFMPICKKPKYVEPKSEPQEDETIFTVQVRGRKLYDFMLEMKKVYYKTNA